MGKIALKKSVCAFIVSASVLFWSLLFFLGLLLECDLRVYDRLLRLKKHPDARKELLLVEIDDQSLAEMGAWPWRRAVLGDALMRMKELGAETAVFAVEFLSPSGRSANPDAQEAISRAFALHKERMAMSVLQLSDEIASGSHSASEIPERARRVLNRSIYPGFDALLGEVEDAIGIDNDGQFARAIQFFGNTWLTINTSDLGLSYTQQDIDYAVERFLRDSEKPKPNAMRGGNGQGQDDEGGMDTKRSDAQERRTDGFSPALPLLMAHAAGAGFTNAASDGDGTLRRVELLAERYGRSVAQLSFAPLLDILSPEKIARTKKRLTIVGAHVPGKEQAEAITIPLDGAGRMYVSWKREPFSETFRHESVLHLARLDLAERRIYSLLGALGELALEDADGTPLEYTRAVSLLLSAYRDILSRKERLLSQCAGYDINGIPEGGGISEAEYAEYAALRDGYFKNLGDFLDGDALSQITGRLSEMRGGLGEKRFAELAGKAESLLGELRSENDWYTRTCAEKREAYKGAFCIIGNTSRDADFCATPFESEYPSAGTHAAVYDTIMGRDFITPIPPAVGIVCAAIFALLSTFGAAKHGVFVQSVMFVGATAAIVFVPVFLMSAFGAYLPAVAPTMIVITAHAGTALWRCARGAKR